MRALWLAVAAGLALAGPAEAKLTEITMKGTIAAKSPSPYTGNTDSPLNVGDTVFATLRFDDYYYLLDGNKTYYNLRTYGGSMDVVAGPIHWTELGDFLDGAAIISCSGEESPNCAQISRPYATFENDVFKGFRVRADTPITAEPDLSVAGFDFKIWEDAYFFYPGPFFTGSFDPASVRIAYVPEPATWAMMITGFGFAGAALRRRKARPGWETLPQL